MDTPDTIRFFSSKEAFGELANFADFGISMDGCWWPTVEHYYQAQKYTDAAYQAAIRAARTPKLAALLGRSRDDLIRPDWPEVKDHVMYDAVLQKCRTHPQVQAVLLATGDKPIVEHSPWDYYWGCGADGSGLNKLGKIWMQVRAWVRAH